MILYAFYVAVLNGLLSGSELWGKKCPSENRKPQVVQIRSFPFSSQPDIHSHVVVNDFIYICIHLILPARATIAGNRIQYLLLHHVTSLAGVHVSGWLKFLLN